MIRSRINEELCLISQVEPKSVDEDTKDNHWMKEMKEELDQITKNDMWEFLEMDNTERRGGESVFYKLFPIVGYY